MRRTLHEVDQIERDKLTLSERNAVVCGHILGWGDVREMGMHGMPAGGDLWTGRDPLDNANRMLPELHRSLDDALAIPRAIMTRTEAFDGYDRNEFTRFLAARIEASAWRQTGIQFVTHDNLMLVGFLDAEAIHEAALHLIWWKRARKNGGR